MKSDYMIFIDFDGTITSNDVGYEMFRIFTNGKTESAVIRYRKDEINSYQCLSEECRIWNEFPPPETEVLDFLYSQELAPGFEDFLGRISENGSNSYILSEGFDFYINLVLEHRGVVGIKTISNRAVWDRGMIVPDFPYKSLGCGECSNCKGYHMSRLSDARKSRIFIGDGHSDNHGAGAADIVFAKSYLRDSMKKSGRFHIEYADFYDIIKYYESIESRNVFAFTERITFFNVDEKRRAQFESLWENGKVMEHVGFPGGLGWTSAQYDKFWRNLVNKDFILLGMENPKGEFIGEAKLSFPDEAKFCNNDVKLLPEFRGSGYGKEAWRFLLEASKRRWPDSIPMVTPSVDNDVAINLYKSLGFEISGDICEWIPPSDSVNAVPIRNYNMIKRK